MQVPLFPLPHPLQHTVTSSQSSSSLLQLRCSMTLPQLKTEPSSGPVQLCCRVPDCATGTAAAARGGGDLGVAVAESLLMLQLSCGPAVEEKLQVKVGPR